MTKYRVREDATRELQREFKLYEYPWPKICGANRAKWERLAKFVDDAAHRQHRHDCPGTMADGRTRQAVPPFTGDHAYSHRHKIIMVLVSMVDAGIPRFLTEIDTATHATPVVAARVFDQGPEDAA